MIAREWSLVVFTLLSQMAVGAFLMVWLTHFVSRQQASDTEVRRLCNGALLGVGPVVIISLLVSLFHLGTPLAAWRAVSNFDSSWISREIAFVLAFSILWSVCAYLQWQGAGSERVRTALSGLTGVVGLLAIFSSAMIYLLPTRPAWNSVATPVLFFASTFLLGSLAAGAIFAVYYLTRGKASETQAMLAKNALKNLMVVTMAVLVIEAVTLAAHVAYLQGGVAAARESGELLLSTYGVWFWLWVAVGMVVGFSLIWVGRRRLVRAEVGVPRSVTRIFLVAFVCILAGEVVGRVLFYSTVVPVGLPGVG